MQANTLPILRTPSTFVQTSAACLTKQNLGYQYNQTAAGHMICTAVRENMAGQTHRTVWQRTCTTDRESTLCQTACIAGKIRFSSLIGLYSCQQRKGLPSCQSCCHGLDKPRPVLVRSFVIHATTFLGAPLQLTTKSSVFLGSISMSCPESFRPMQSLSAKPC